MIIAKMPQQFLITPAVGLIKDPTGIMLSIGWMNYCISIYIARFFQEG